MAAKKYKFESEVHLGLLAFIFVLLFLNFVSNYVVFKTRIAVHDNAAAAFRTASIEIGRVVQQAGPADVKEQQKQDLMLKYRLSGLLVV